MSAWNYRPVRHEEPSKLDDSVDVWWGLHEVYYDDTGTPIMFAPEPDVVGDTHEELIHTLELMLKDARERPPFEPPEK